MTYMYTNCPYCFSAVDTGGNCHNTKCPGKTRWTPNGPLSPLPEYPIYPTPVAPTGWICPRCGAGLAPTTTKCDCHIKYYTTTGTDIGQNRNDT